MIRWTSVSNEEASHVTLRPAVANPAKLWEYADCRKIRLYKTLIDLIEPEFQRLGLTTERVVIPDDKVATIPLLLECPRVILVATAT